MATKSNIIINQGADFSQNFEMLSNTGDPLIVTDGGGNNVYSVEAMMRKSYAASNNTVFDVALANGIVTLSLSAAVTDTIVAGRYVYTADITAIGANTIDRLVEGVVTVSPTAIK